MRISELGERGLIERIRRRVEALAPPGAGVLTGIGDDAAVLAPPTAPLLATCDLLVEGVHFLLPETGAHDLGHKALAAGLSDVAAMGGRPRYALVSLALPGRVDVGFVDGLYQGLGDLARASGVAVVGGDTTGSPGPLVVDVFVLGEVLPGGPFPAAAARPGQAVLATGAFGASAAGLEVIRRGAPDAGGGRRAGGAAAPPWAGAAAAAREAHFRPRPRLAEAAALAGLAAAGGWRPAARDASDGLAAAARAIAAAGGCAVELDEAAVPVAAAARELAAAFGADALEWALFGGEDYELVFTAPSEAAAEVARALAARTGTPVAVVGRVTAGEGVVLVRRNGAWLPLPDRSFRHFAAAGGGTA